MNELINVTLNDNHEPIVSARQLHQTLEVKRRFSAWFEVNSKLFIENEDFTSVQTGTVVNNGAVKPLQDYALTLDMAKQLAMMSRTTKGAEVRAYFIQIEKDYNSPEKIMARALLMADKKVHKLEAQIEADRPKVLFADAVSASHTSILVGEPMENNLIGKYLEISGEIAGQIVAEEKDLLVRRAIVLDEHIGLCEQAVYVDKKVLDSYWVKVVDLPTIPETVNSVDSTDLIRKMLNM